jgi:hypothetical protein
LRDLSNLSGDKYAIVAMANDVVENTILASVLGLGDGVR